MGSRPQSRVDRGTVQLVDLLDFAIEQANDGIAIMRFTGDRAVPIRIVYANAAIERFSGFSRSELLDPQNPFLRAQPENRQRYEALLQKVRSGEPVRFEIALGGKDRSTWCEIRWSPLEYAQGNVTHYVAVLREHPIVNGRSAACVFEVSENGQPRRRLAYVNDAMYALLKIPTARTFPDAVEQSLAQALEDGPAEREILVHLADGPARWMHVTRSEVASDEAGVDRITLVCDDIDEKRCHDEPDAVIPAVVSKTADFVVMIDPRAQGGPRISYANRAASDSLSRHVQEHILACVAGRDDEPISFDDGRVELTGHPLRDEAGRVVSWLFIGRDFSARS